MPNSLASDKVLQLSLVEPRDEVLLRCALELGLKCVKQHAAQLLNVVLLKCYQYL